MFDWENAIALHAMQGNRASSCGEGDVPQCGSPPFYPTQGSLSFLMLTFMSLPS